MAREVNQLLGHVFAQRRKDGRTDLEAVESALRTALHHAGAAALSELLQFETPAADQRQLPCPCGHHAQYQEIRSKPILTIVGPVRMARPYYLCSQCHVGQFPVDVELDIENTEFSPGVRRMHALVGQEAPFDHGREQMQLLAGLEVTTKSVERIAEAIGGDIAQREQGEIQKAMQLDLPVLVGQPIPILYVQMDGTGVPVVKKETVGRQGKTEGQPAHTREVKLGCGFTQTTWDEKGFAIRDPDSTTYTGAIETAEQFGKRIYLEALKRGWSRAKKKVVIGDGAVWIWTLVAEHFPDAIQIVRPRPCSPASVGGGAPAVSPPGSPTESLDEGPPEAPAGQGENRKTGERAAGHSRWQSHNGREDSHRGRLLREKCSADALSQVSPPTLVCWLGCDRSWMQDRDRLSSQTIGNVLDRPGSQRDPGAALLSSQWPF